MATLYDLAADVRYARQSLALATDVLTRMQVVLGPLADNDYAVDMLDRARALVANVTEARDECLANYDAARQAFPGPPQTKLVNGVLFHWAPALGCYVTIPED